jgi:hypothetical protein
MPTGSRLTIGSALIASAIEQIDFEMADRIPSMDEGCIVSDERKGGALDWRRTWRRQSLRWVCQPMPAASALAPRRALADGVLLQGDPR